MNTIPQTSQLGQVGFTGLPLLLKAKNWVDLAQSAYEAYCKGIREIRDEGAYCTSAWAELPEDYRLCWVAVAKQMWAEHTAMRSLISQSFALDGGASDPHSVAPGTRQVTGERA